MNGSAAQRREPASVLNGLVTSSEDAPSDEKQIDLLAPVREPAGAGTDIRSESRAYAAAFPADGANPSAAHATDEHPRGAHPMLICSADDPLMPSPTPVPPAPPAPGDPPADLPGDPIPPPVPGPGQPKPGPTPDRPISASMTSRP